VLDGRADHVALNAPERYLGGAHLTRDEVWRWDAESETLVR
jgi:hypothetical protein